MSDRAQEATAVSNPAGARVKPATALPWERDSDDPGAIVSPADDFTLVTASLNDPRGPLDATYIVHAANNYPRLVAALQAYLNTADNPLGMSDLADIDAAARQLLRELGEIK